MLNQLNVLGTQAVSPPESFGHRENTDALFNFIVNSLLQNSDKLSAIHHAGGWSKQNGYSLSDFATESFKALLFVKEQSQPAERVILDSVIHQWINQLRLSKADAELLLDKARSALRKIQAPSTIPTSIPTSFATGATPVETQLQRNTLLQSNNLLQPPESLSALMPVTPHTSAIAKQSAERINPQPIQTAPPQPLAIAEDLPTVDLEAAITNTQLLNQLGESIARLYRDYLAFPSVQYVPPGVNHLRVLRLIFKCAIKDFIRFRQMSSEAAMMGLRYLGIEKVNIVPGVRGVFEIQIPKPETLWESLRFSRLLDYSSDGTIVQALPTEPPRIPVGVDLEDNRIYLSFLQPVMYAGMTRSGKSNLARQVALQLCLRYHPTYICLVEIDLRVKTFSSFEGLPHLWNGEVITSVERAFHVLRIVMEEYKRRDKLFAKAGVDNLWAYNKKQMEERKPLLPIWFINIEEIDTLRYGQGKAVCMELDALLEEGVRTTSGNGILWFLGAHTPTEQSVSTDVRDQTPTRVLLHSTEHASQFILDRKGADGNVGANLVGKGDCWIRYMGSPLVRAQLGHVEDDYLVRNTKRLKHHYRNYKPTVLDDLLVDQKLLPGDVGYPKDKVPQQAEVDAAIANLLSD